MSHLTDSDKKALLTLARSVIAAELVRGKKPIQPEKLSEEMTRKRGCFVSLHKTGDLRGCIGTIEPIVPVIRGIEENAKNAAFHDPRFSPLRKEELDSVDIEISILTEPRVLVFKDSDDLKHQLKPGIHGVILSKGYQRATFLPQVWDQLSDTEDFLSELCRKAGMGRSCWKTGGVTVSVYEVENFSE
ncbi:MAG: AmmeMemoRadiSam system protein A [Pseudomonadota bacterium]